MLSGTDGKARIESLTKGLNECRLVSNHPAEKVGLDIIVLIMNLMPTIFLAEGEHKCRGSIRLTDGLPDTAFIKQWKVRNWVQN